MRIQGIFLNCTNSTIWLIKAKNYCIVFNLWHYAQLASVNGTIMVRHITAHGVLRSQHLCKGYHFVDERLKTIQELIINQLAESDIRRRLQDEIAVIAQILKQDVKNNRISASAVNDIFNSLENAVNNSARGYKSIAQTCITRAKRVCVYNTAMMKNWVIVGMILGAIVEAAILAAITIASHGLAMPALAWIANVTCGGLVGSVLGFHTVKNHQEKLNTHLDKCRTLFDNIPQKNITSDVQVNTPTVK